MKAVVSVTADTAPEHVTIADKINCLALGPS